MMIRIKTPILASVALFSLFSLSLFAESPDEMLYADGSTSFLTEKLSGNTYDKWDYFIYPVPVSDVLNIKITKGDVKIDKVVIIDENGSEIMVITQQYSDKLKLNLADLQPGNYSIQIDSDAYQMSKMKRFYIIE
jgi:hypothetical protein